MGTVTPKILRSCPVCKTSKISLIKSLPKYPITELFHNKDETPNFSITEVDQEFCICNQCSHGFLKTVVPPEYLYADSNYNTVTTESGGAILSVKNFTNFILKNGYESNYTLDIGGNSSSLLEDITAPSGCVIDPNAKLAEGSKYDVLNSFFEKVETKDFDKKGLTIVSSHTLEHIESPTKFFEFLNSFNNLEKVYLQFPSLELMVESNRYDLINNQHLHYFTIKSITNLANNFGFKLIKFEFDIEHYGTLRVMLVPQKNNINSNQSFSNYSKENQISKQFISQRLNQFTESAYFLNELIEDIDELYCYGASLMLPILFWYHPSLKKAKGIFDQNRQKQFLKYANIPVPIMHDTSDFNMKDISLCISAVATRMAHRKILSKVLEREPRYVLSPFMTI
tara:strand:- start:967 stop:2157 length:1191 start_codon:yes stop_codon:yes gene_type:complete